MTITSSQLQPIATAWQSALNTLNALIIANSGASPPGTSITAPTSATLIDAQGGVWSFAGPSIGYYEILLNGVSAGGVSNTLEIDINGVIWADQIGNSWFKWNGATWDGGAGPVI